MAIVVLDAGHGGGDPGASGFGLKEKDLALNIVEKVKSHLDERNITVHMTREADTFVSLSKRAQVANNVGADLFVSFHHNSGGGTGFESHILTGLRQSKTGTIQDKIHAFIMDFYASYGLRDRGKKETNLAVLRKTEMSAVLLENLFLDSKTDTQHLKKSAFINELSSTIAEGILKVLK